MKIVDYHIHTSFSHDSEVPMKSRVEEAISKGIYELGFSDHVSTTPSSTEYGKFDMEGYIKAFSELKASYGDKVSLKLGIEFGYNKKYEEDAKKLLSSLSIDYVIGSVHRINDIPFSSSKGHDEFFSKYDKDEAYTLYYNELLDMVSSGLIDIVGHFDIVKKYAPLHIADFSSKKYMENIIPILYYMKSRDIPLEINTSGLTHPCKEPYPAIYIIEAYYEVGGRLFTFGSDAHHEGELGRLYDEFINILKRFNIREVAVFNERKIDTIRIY